MFGSHLSIAGSMADALREAESLDLDCVQVFTKNQQQWKSPPLKPEAVADWSAELARLGWSAAPGEPARTVSHASYLANLGSPDDELREKSIALMREELDRCHALGIPLLVFHPGASRDAPREEGLARVADACARLIRDTPDHRVTLCLENVAGAGSHLGRTFEELADLRQRILAATGGAAFQSARVPPVRSRSGGLVPPTATEHPRIGFCLDTCHAHAAGYDLSTTAKAEAALAEADRVLGLANVRALHVNDSKGAAGSRLDRHEHIGKGTIGQAGFAVVVNHPAFAAVPKILETPKGDGPRGTPWDTINVRLLRSLLIAPIPLRNAAPNADGVPRGPAKRRGRSSSPATNSPRSKPTKSRTQPRPKRRPRPKAR